MSSSLLPRAVGPLCTSLRRSPPRRSLARASPRRPPARAPARRPAAPQAGRWHRVAGDGPDRPPGRTAAAGPRGARANDDGPPERLPGIQLFARRSASVSRRAPASRRRSSRAPAEIARCAAVRGAPPAPNRRCPAPVPAVPVSAVHRMAPSGARYSPRRPGPARGHTGPGSFGAPGAPRRRSCRRHRAHHGDDPAAGTGRTTATILPQAPGAPRRRSCRRRRAPTDAARSQAAGSLRDPL